ncbi:HNH endonuclease, partial [Mycobacterium sp. Y57]|nr:HNH endonuclease [Mycolicibacterium xanthum]
ACYCRLHHRLKTFDCGWTDRQLADGIIVWTSPTGDEYRTAPASADLFPGLARRRPEDRARVAAARKRLREHLPHTEYHRYRNRAARTETAHRTWRNRARWYRTLFHGCPPGVKPSTSPFMAFVNEPYEPETLPPDWQPPPMTPHDPDEPPPF